MKIADNSAAKKVDFEALDQGTVFEYAGSYYMKTETVADALSLKCNAVNVIDGSMARFDSYNLIHVIDCELTIK